MTLTEQLQKLVDAANKRLPDCAFEDDYVDRGLREAITNAPALIEAVRAMEAKQSLSILNQPKGDC